MNFWSIFLAALRSVGIAGSMAFGGFYLHRRKLVTTGGTKMLAVLTQQVTIPAFLFTKVVLCRKQPDDSSDETGAEGQGSGTCGSVTDDMGDIWVLVLWPLYVVGCGLFVGYVAAKLSNLPRSQLPISLVACSLTNSTALPIVLLTVIHENPPTPELGKVDPILFLSIYLLFFPVFMWGMGGWLLGESPVESDNEPKEQADMQTSKEEISNLLENIKSSDENKSGVITCSTSLESLTSMRKVSSDYGTTTTAPDRTSVGLAYTDDAISDGDVETQGDDMASPPYDVESVVMLNSGSESDLSSCRPLHELTDSDCESRDGNEIARNTGGPSFAETLGNLRSKILQPPVVASLSGLVIASVRPLRAIFVDAYSLGHDAPMQWAFDGMYSLGQAAVPVSMTLLGIHLSKTLKSSGGDNGTAKKMLSTKPTVAIVAGKMVAMPLLGALSVFLIKNYLWDIPQTIASSFYLVMMIEFITPTATNVMVIVELSGSGSQENMARIIGWQYAVAPVLLSLSVALVVAVASH